MFVGMDLMSAVWNPTCTQQDPSPMRTIPFGGWIAHAAARWVGTHGAVTANAQETGCSRQCVYDHAQKVLAAVQAEHSGGPTREELIPQNDALRRENAQLWDWLFQTIEFPLAQ